MKRYSKRICSQERKNLVDAVPTLCCTATLALRLAPYIRVHIHRIRHIKGNAKQVREL